MVLTYSQLDQTKDAYEYMKKEAGAVEAFRLTGKLAAVYKEQGKSPLQIDTLRLLINLEPDNTQAPDYQSSIVEAYAKLADRESVKKEVTRLVELYRPGSPWWRKNEANKASVERARAVAENRMRELVTDYHRFAQKFKKYDDYDAAANIYDQYLQAFPDSENAYRLNFFYAELLWDLGKWREAAKQYDAVVKRDPKGEYTRTCAFNAVLALGEDREQGRAARRSRPTGSSRRQGLHARGREKARQVRAPTARPATQDRDASEVDDREARQEAGKKYDPLPIPTDEIALASACDAYVVRRDRQTTSTRTRSSRKSCRS